MADSFSKQLNGFSVKVFRMEREVFHGVTEEVQRSIVEGSELTGAVGQPVDTGALKASWTPQFVSPTEWRTTTHLAYAPGIEDGISSHGTPITFRSQVGGKHSLKQTRIGFPRIVDYIVSKVRGRNGT
jgi:hypothetical protein